MDEADVIVVNTCAFISDAREESLGVIAEAIEHKKNGRCSRVVVAGCLPSLIGEGINDTEGEIDAAIGVDDRDRIVEAVTGDRETPRTCDGDMGRFRLTPRHTAYLRIAEGCSRKCTFCSIPAIRGPFRSKPPDLVEAEARELISDGAVELNIIAQETTGYGEDIGTDLPSLLRRLDTIEGARWLRLMYTYPRRFSDQLIEAMASCSDVLPYVDLPLQHITTAMLNRMGRGINRQKTEQLLYRLRDRIPGIAMRTTFLVGFPGETEDDFRQLLDFVREFRFDALGVFEFSPEQGTPAASMDGLVANETARARAGELMEVQREIAFEIADALEGREIDILVDGTDPSGDCVGRSSAQAPDVDSICILTEAREPGRFVRAKVAGRRDYDLVVTP
jgi:ribosomal protein S12 methylthiotransferase